MDACRSWMAFPVDTPKTLGLSRIVVPILGMHRSGTSMVARALHGMGVDLGSPLLGPRPANPKGFWENQAIIYFNQQMLGTFGCDTDGFDQADTLKHAASKLGRMQMPAEFLERLNGFLGDNFSGLHWGFKDPRTVITYPLWQRILASLGYEDVRPIVVVRNPASSIRSLVRRGDLARRGSEPEAFAAQIWTTYHRLLLSYLPADTPIFLQEDFLDSDLAPEVMSRLANRLSLPEARVSPALATIESGLVNHRGLEPTSIEETDEIYTVLKARAEGQLRRTAPAATTPVQSSPSSLKGAWSIYIVSSTGDVHGGAFEEHALSLHHGLRALGHTAPIVHNIWEVEGRPIVLRGHRIPAGKIDQLPKGSIIYNLEQVSGESTIFEPHYIELMKRHTTWDYSIRNAHELRSRFGVDAGAICTVGYRPELKMVPKRDKDIDVLFYGSVNERRARVLEQLAARGLRVKVLFGVYGGARDEFIARSKVILNVHFYRSKVLELMRLSYLLANGCFVVSERGAEPEVSEPLTGGVAFADYHELVDCCLRYLTDDIGRRTVSELGTELISQWDQADILRAAIKSLPSPAKSRAAQPSVLASR